MKSAVLLDGALRLQGPVQTLNVYESAIVLHVVEVFDSNITHAAAALGIGRATLYRKIREAKKYRNRRCSSPAGATPDERKRCR